MSRYTEETTRDAPPAHHPAVCSMARALAEIEQIPTGHLQVDILVLASFHPAERNSSPSSSGNEKEWYSGCLFRVGSNSVQATMTSCGSLVDLTTSNLDFWLVPSPRRWWVLWKDPTRRLTGFERRQSSSQTASLCRVADPDLRGLR